MGGQSVDMRGFCPGFVHPERRWDTLLMSLIIVFGRQISGQHRIWVEVGSQGVPQTGKIIEVKKTTFEVFFFDLRGLGGFVWGCMARSDVSGALVILTDMAKTELKLFCLYFLTK